MLLSYGANNFFCFKEGIDISFRLGAKCPVNISNGKSYSDILCIKGANGSGKTNALKALSFIGMFCSASFNNDIDDPIGIESFYSNDEPTSFYAEFSIDGMLYRYELSLTKNEVISETLFRKAKRQSPIIERKGNELTVCVKEFHGLKVVKLRTNASLISCANQYDIDCIKPIYNFFNHIGSNVSFFGRHERHPEISTLSKFFSKDEVYFKFVKEIITACDHGIEDIIISDYTDKKDEKIFFPLFAHRVNGKKELLLYDLESSGTKSLFRQLFRYKTALDDGGVLILDEFDINLHPHILPLLLKLFLDKSINTKNAQLVFSTHNTTILDFLGKYRAYLVNKEENESYVYRLDEIPSDILRNDRPISPIYNSGKIGGIPKL